MATHSSILAWRILWIEEPGGLQSMGVRKSQTRLEQFNTHMHARSASQAFGGRVDIPGQIVQRKAETLLLGVRGDRCGCLLPGSPSKGSKDSVPSSCSLLGASFSSPSFPAWCGCPDRCLFSASRRAGCESRGLWEEGCLRCLLEQIASGGKYTKTKLSSLLFHMKTSPWVADAR